MADLKVGAMQWYYSKGSSQFGPVPEEELKAKIATGEVGGSDLVWKDGMRDWTAVSRVSELQEQPSVVSTGYDTGGYDRSAGTRAESPYQSPAAGGPPPVAIGTAPATSGLAIASLVCGIVGLLSCLLPGIAAVICGHMALGQIEASQGRLGGRGMAVAGLVLGYLSILVLLLFAVLMIGGLLSASSAQPRPI